MMTTEVGDELPTTATAVAAATAIGGAAAVATVGTSNDDS